MQITDKLNALMMLSRASNIKLARALNIDASLVSRWRNGSRIPNPQYFLPLATFFANSATENFQKLTIATLLGINENINVLTCDYLISGIQQWLAIGDVSHDVLSRFIRSFAEEPEPLTEGLQQPEDLKRRFFCGPAGMRESLRIFIQLLEMKHYQGDILIFSDKAINWLTEDSQIYRQTISILTRLGTGTRIIMIHPITNHAPDIFEQLDALLPLYRTINVQPYYCPTYKTNIFSQFLCIAPGVCAIASQGVGDNSTAPVTLYRDSDMVHILTKEFKHFLSMCKPFFQTYGTNESQQIIEIAAEWHVQPGDVYSKGNVLPQISMPPDLMEETIERTHASAMEKKLWKEAAFKRNQEFLRHLLNNQVYITLSLPTVDDVQSGNVPVLHSQVYFHEVIPYTLSGYKRHLQYVLELMESYPNLHISLTRESWPDIFIVAISGVGATIHKTRPPMLTLSSTHSGLVDTIYFYLENEYEKLSLQERNKANTVRSLNAVLAEMKEACDITSL